MHEQIVGIRRLEMMMHDNENCHKAIPKVWITQEHH